MQPNWKILLTQRGETMASEPIEILLVEDNPSDVQLTLRALSKAKLANAIHVARDGEEALNFLLGQGRGGGQDLSRLHLVLLDLKLPKVDGLEVLQAIRSDERTKVLPVVVLTSSNEQKDIMDSYNLGVNSYIQKPVDFEKFQHTVGQLGFYWLLINEPPQL
jgi:two-component system response regulator